MYDFFSIPVVYIDNRGQFLIPLFIYFSRILDSPQSRQSAKLFLQSSDGTLPHSLAGDGVGSPNSDEGTDTVVLQVYMYFVENGYRGNACEIFKMINR